MAVAFDGDLIRPLGLVTLYFAYAEGELDELLRSLSVVGIGDTETVRWAVGKKLTRASQLIRAFGLKETSESLLLLSEGRGLFRDRNELVHGRLYAGGRLVSTDPNVAERRVTPEQLTELAESAWNWKERLGVHRSRVLLPLLERAAGS